MSNTEIEQYFKDNNINIDNLKSIGYLLQKNNDLLLGGLRSCSVKTFRNTYVINAQDSLDATYPMYVNFNIIDEMVKIVSIKLSFWLLPFRAYSQGAASGGGSTSGATGIASGGGSTSGTTSTPSGGGSTTPSGGGSTTPSGGGGTTPSGGGSTSGSSQVNHRHGLIEPAPGAWTFYQTSEHTHSTPAHTHSTPSHIHSTPNHTHATPDHTHPEHTHTTPDHTHAEHTHTTPAHAHAITFGIHEESNSPTIGFQISRDNGKTYGAVLGQYTADVINLEIKDYIEKAGSYIIKFISTTRARISAQITCKLDISART